MLNSFYSNAQHINVNFFVTDNNNTPKEWYGQTYDPDVKVTKFIYKTGSKTHNITSFVFMKDGSFVWNDHPKCKVHDKAINGSGSWKLENDILILDFKKVETEIHGTRNTEKYKIVSLNKNEMVLNVLK